MPVLLERPVSSCSCKSTARNCRPGGLLCLEASASVTKGPSSGEGYRNGVSGSGVYDRFQLIGFMIAADEP
eukprot:scaffold59395_cov35-Prasinocladus_malaysianus.AAC.2